MSRMLFAAVVLGFCLILPSFVAQMRLRPVEVKLGYMPHPQVVRTISGEFAPLLAEMSVLDVLFYYGTLIDKWQQNIIIRPEYLNMFRRLVSVTELDPYNQDAYYFAQAAFTWELGRINEVNWLLKRGMEYRTRDPWLPFYVGFNEAYFLKNYSEAAKYMQISAELSGDSLRTKLASRYLYESNRTGIALSFLNAMIEREKNPAVKKTYEIRKKAFEAVALIENALVAYKDKFGSGATHLNELISSGVLLVLPIDPYGGEFYLGQDGRVRSTSNFAATQK